MKVRRIDGKEPMATGTVEKDERLKCFSHGVTELSRGGVEATANSLPPS